MQSNINFLREHVRLQELTLNRDKRIALISTVALGIFALLCVSIGGFSYTLRMQRAVTAQTMNELAARLTTLEQVREIFVQNTSFLQLGQKVMDTRTKTWETVASFQALLPQGTTIESIDLSGENNALLFSLQSTNIFAYRALVAFLQQDDLAQKGYVFEPGELTRADDGTYTLAVRLTIKQGAQTQQTEGAL